MQDGTCLVTVVAGASFLLLMELSRLGAFTAVGHALSAEFAPAKVPAAQTLAAKGASKGTSVIRAEDAAATSSPQYIHVASGRTGPHHARSRDRAGDRD